MSVGLHRLKVDTSASVGRPCYPYPLAVASIDPISLSQGRSRSLTSEMFLTPPRTPLAHAPHQMGSGEKTHAGLQAVVGHLPIRNEIFMYQNEWTPRDQERADLFNLVQRL